MTLPANLQEEQVVYNKKTEEIFIDFPSMLKIDLKPDYLRFSLADKRVFKNLSDRLVENLKIIFEMNKDIKWQYLNIKSRIIEELDEYSEGEFVDDVIAIFEESVIRDIQSHIDTIYKIDIDDLSKNAKNKNTELQFTNEHAKVLQYSAFAQRIVAPLVTDYIQYAYDRREKRKEYFKSDETLLMAIFSEIIKVFDKGRMNTLNKLFRFINSRITATRSSDAPIWSYISNMSKTITTETSEHYRKMIISIIPKLKEDKNVVSFAHMVMRYSLTYVFKYNYPISYSPVDTNKVDKDGLTEFEKIDINLTKHDEFYRGLVMASIPYEIDNIKRLHDVSVTDEELKFYSKNLDINNIQKMIVFYTMSKYFGGNKILNFVNNKQYVELCLLTSKIMKKQGFQILPELVLSNPEEQKGRRKMTRNKSFLDSLANSTKFRDMHNMYSFIETKMYQTNEFIKSIMAIENTPFYKLDQEDPKSKEKVATPTLDLTDEMMDLIILI